MVTKLALISSITEEILSVFCYYLKSCNFYLIVFYFSKNLLIHQNVILFNQIDLLFCMQLVTSTPLDFVLKVNQHIFTKIKNHKQMYVTGLQRKQKTFKKCPIWTILYTSPLLLSKNINKFCRCRRFKEI